MSFWRGIRHIFKVILKFNGTSREYARKTMNSLTKPRRDTKSIKGNEDSKEELGTRSIERRSLTKWTRRSVRGFLIKSSKNVKKGS